MTDKATEHDRNGPCSSTSGLRTLSAVGLKWLALGMAFQKVYQFAAVLVLARVLAPEDFGLLTVATLTLGLVAHIKQMGMHSALIRQKTDLEEARNTYFFVNLGLAGAVCLVVVFFAAPVAGFFRNERAAAVLSIMSLQLLFEGAAAVQRAEAVRAMRFKRQTLVTMSESLVNGAVSVALALSGCGVWALVGGALAASAFGTALWWRLDAWRPSLRLSRRVAREFLGVGLRFSASSVLDMALSTLSWLFIGRILGVVALGYHNFSSRAVSQPFRQVVALGQRVALPAFCRLQDERERLARWYLKLTGYSCLLVAPVTVLVLLLGDQIIPVLYGAKWAPAVPLVRILSLSVFVMPLAYAWPVYVATGRAGVLSKVMAVRLALTAPLLFLAARESLSAVCWVELASLLALAVVNLCVMRRVLGLSVRCLAGTVGLPLAGMAVLAVVVWGLRLAAARLTDDPSLGTVALIVGPGLLVYLGTVCLIRPGLVADVKGLVRRSLGHEAL